MHTGPVVTGVLFHLICLILPIRGLLFHRLGFYSTFTKYSTHLAIPKEITM